jgi:O-antigen ligase
MSLIRKGNVYYHSHSGYLEMVLSIGIIGAVLHVLTLLLGIRWLIKGYLRLGNEGYAFGAALVITLMVSMFTETTNMSTYLAPTFLDMAFLMHAAFIRQPGEVDVPPPLPVRPTVYHLSASL